MDGVVKHLYGGLKWWLERRETYQGATKVFINDEIVNQKGYSESWRAIDPFHHMIDDSPIGQEDYNIKCFYGNGDSDDNYDCIKVYGHCVAGWCEMPYTEGFTSVQFIAIAPTTEALNGINRFHNGFYDSYLEFPLHIQDQTIYIESLDQNWYVAIGGFIRATNQELIRTFNCGYVEGVGTSIDDFDIIATAQRLSGTSKDYRWWWFSCYKVRNSDYKDYIFLGGFVQEEEGQEYKDKDLPFRVTRGGTVYCVGLNLNGQEIYKIVSNVRINGNTIVNPKNGVAEF